MKSRKNPYIYSLKMRFFPIFYVELFFKRGQIQSKNGPDYLVLFFINHSGNSFRATSYNNSFLFSLQKEKHDKK